MDKKIADYWITEYYKTENPDDAKIEKDLTKNIQQKGFATKEDIEKLLVWKFGMNKNRLITVGNQVKRMTSKEIESITKEALQKQTDLEKIKILKQIKGFGNAVTSVFLTFSNPQNYGVFDIHAWRELFGSEKESKDYDSTAALIRFEEKLRELSKAVGLPCREVEKAVFTKNYIESKQSPIKHK